MKKLFIKLLVICLLVPFIGTFEVSAQDLKSCGYEVAYINDDGSFARPYAFASGSNSVELRSPDGLVQRRVQFYDERQGQFFVLFF